MYKNLSEIEAHKKKPPFKLFVPKKAFFSLSFTMFNRREQFFQSGVFLYFTKVLVIHSSMDTVFFRKLLAAFNCAYAIYLTDISIQIVLLFERSTCSHTSDWSCRYFRRPPAIIPFFRGIECKLTPVAATYSINGPFPIIKEQLQPSI